MDNGAQTDRYSNHYVKNNKIIHIYYSNMSLTFSVYSSDLQENKRHSRANAHIVPHDCGPSLQRVDFTTYRVNVH